MEKIWKEENLLNRIHMCENFEEEIFYHGSKQKFDSFSYDNISLSERLSQIGAGFYFTNVYEEAKSYGSYVYKCRLNVKNTFDVNRDVLSPKQLSSIFQQGDNTWFMKSFLPKKVLTLNSNARKIGVSSNVYTDEEIKGFSLNQLCDYYANHIIKVCNNYDTYKDAFSSMVSFYKNPKKLLSVEKEILGIDSVYELVNRRNNLVQVCVLDSYSIDILDVENG